MEKKVFLSVYEVENPKGWRYEFRDASGVLLEGWFNDWDEGIAKAAHEVLEFQKEGKSINGNLETTDLKSYIFSYAITGYLEAYVHFFLRFRDIVQ